MRGALPEEVAEANLESLRAEVKRLGYDSLYSALLEDAKIENEEFCKFVESGGLNKLHEEYARVRRIRTPNLDPVELRRRLCEPALNIMKREWKGLTNQTELFKIPLNAFPPSYVEDFTYGKGIQSLAEFKNIERYIKYTEDILGLNKPTYSEDNSDQEGEVQENEEEAEDDEDEWGDFLAGWFDEDLDNDDLLL